LPMCVALRESFPSVEKRARGQEPG
jgi:hypothetical protein